MKSDADVARMTAIAILVAAGFYVAWQLIDIFLLVFAAILVALGLQALAAPITRITGVKQRYVIFPVALLMIGGLTLVGYQFGSTIQVQVSELVYNLPAAWKTFHDTFHLGDMIPGLIRRAEAAAPPSATLIAVAQDFTTNLFQVVLGAFLVLAGGLYFAIEPEVHHKLVLNLWSTEERPIIAERMNRIAGNLRNFLKAQMLAMVVVGVLTFIGLSIVGVPSALALALFATLAEFVPMVGPVVAAIPALLIALTLGVDSALWTLVVFIVVQQTESNIITPVLQQRMVALPPAVTLFAVVAFGSLFGPLGLLLATPLTVLAFSALREYEAANAA